MRYLALLVLVTVSLAAFAQQPASSAPAEPAANNALDAPVLGHPLDPNDVMVLTGKDRQAQRPYATPNVYYGTPGYGTSPYSVPVTMPLDQPNPMLDATLPVAPLAFGRFNRQPFVFFGDNRFTPFVFNSNPFLFDPFVFGPRFTPFGLFGPGRHFRGFVF